MAPHRRSRETELTRSIFAAGSRRGASQQAAPSSPPCPPPSPLTPQSAPPLPHRCCKCARRGTWPPVSRPSASRPLHLQRAADQAAKCGPLCFILAPTCSSTRGAPGRVASPAGRRASRGGRSRQPGRARHGARHSLQRAERERPRSGERRRSTISIGRRLQVRVCVPVGHGFVPQFRSQASASVYGPGCQILRAPTASSRNCSPDAPMQLRSLSVAVTLAVPLCASPPAATTLASDTLNSGMNLS